MEVHRVRLHGQIMLLLADETKAGTFLEARDVGVHVLHALEGSQQVVPLVLV